jgi:hypothetical protein
MTPQGKSAGHSAKRQSPGESSLPADQRPIRGYERLRLLRDLATSPSTPRELARDYGIPYAVLRDFQQSHQEEIAELQQAIVTGQPTETQGMWITKKHNRLAELEHEAEQIRDTLQDYRDSDIPWSRAHRDMIRTYLEILRSVADETGAYPQRQSAPARSGQTVHYVIDTEDSESLQ